MDTHTFGYENTNHDGSISEVEWDVKDFWRAAKGKPTRLFDTHDLMEQVRVAIEEYDDTDEERIKNGNLKYPIILSPGMKLLDGVHRLVKQHRMGIRQVKCVVLDAMPKPIKLEGTPFAIAGIPFVWSLENQGVTMPTAID